MWRGFPFGESFEGLLIGLLAILFGIVIFAVVIEAIINDRRKR